MHAQDSRLSVSDGADLHLPFDAFVRSIAVRRTSPLALFIGAGASVSSGIPSALDCIKEWKRDIFLSKNPDLREQFRELTVPSVLERIQRWLDQQGIYPPDGDASEYSFYIERCYPISEDRRLFFQSKIASARPNSGYELLALLASRQRVSSVWTTNFDGLTSRAASASHVPVYEVGLDSVDRLTRYTVADGLLAVSMHGDYRYDPLKNTAEELQRADAKVRQHLITHLRDTSMLVVGYSGRDESVMTTLKQAYQKPGPGALYWCGYADIPSVSVAELIRIARVAGRTAHFVPAQGFDDLLWRLCVQSLPHEDQTRVRELAASLRAGPPRSPFQLPLWPETGFIKSNAFAVELPAELFEVELTNWPDDRSHWAYADEVSAGNDVVAAPFKGKMLALGTVDGVKTALGTRFKSIARTPIGDQELGYDDGVVVKLLRTALAKSMAAVAGVRFDGRSLLWEPGAVDRATVGGTRYEVHEAAHCSLRRIGGTSYLVLKPTLHITDSAGTKVPKEISQPIVMQMLGYQHNAEFNQVMNRWRNTLFRVATAFEFPSNGAGQFRFVVRKSPVFASVRGQGARAVAIPRQLSAHIRQDGVELPEPKLVFASSRGETNAEETHPIRGITTNYPFDYALTLKGFAPNVTLGMVCPTSLQVPVSRFFNQLHSRQATQPADAEYLVDFPGFEGVFRLPVNVPHPGESRWTSVEEPGSGDHSAEARVLSTNIVRAIEQLHAHGTSAVIIVVPDRWEPWTKIDSDDAKFDLHDFVKAFCVQRGIATQFLRESTLRDPQTCRVMWWLSLALYAKAMRTPWVLRGLNDGTAFVGLGFSLDRNAPRGSHVLLGCSHIYNSRGEGMEYRLSKIENPIMRGKNPFMSQDDAARVGRTIQELYFTARGDLPRRVVIHKQTPFIAEERAGLLDGLRGVNSVDLIEISTTPLRYVASKHLGNGRFDEDQWPVKRGTVVKLDAYSALVWVHGLAAALNPGRKYFQGKRRIPSPLLIRRHVGDTELVTVAEEILALSKMDWNSFDMYQRFPATLQSSGEIARIGALLQRFGNLSYDYRLFI